MAKLSISWNYINLKFCQQSDSAAWIDPGLA